MTRLNARKKTLAVAAGLTAVIMVAGGAWAYWTATSADGSYGAAAAGEMPQGTSPSASNADSNPHDVLVSWTPTELTGGAEVSGYEVTRYDAAGPDDSEACDGTVGPDVVDGYVTCVDEDVPTGAYVYTVTPVLNNWVGPESDESGEVTVGEATLEIDPPTTITDLPATLTGEIDGFFGGEVVSFEDEDGNELDGTVDGVETDGETPAAVSMMGDADVTIELPSDFEEGTNTIYAIGEGYEITHDDLTTEQVPGNVASAGIVVDTIAPTVTLTSTPTDPTTETTATFGFETTQETATFQCKLDTAAFAPCTSTITYGSAESPLAQGSHTFQVKATDGAGNEGPATSFTWMINSADPPEVTVTFPADTGSYNASTYTAGCAPLIDDICGTATAGGAALVKVEVSIRQGTGNYWDGDGFDSPTEVLHLASGTATWTRGFAGTNFAVDGSYTVRALVTDASTATASDSNTFTIDNTAPQVSSINTADPNPTNLSVVDYTVTFTESVTGVDTTDFSLNPSGVSGASIVSVTGTGSTRNVEVNTGTGDGTIRLDLTDNNTIVDGAGNVLIGPIDGNGSFQGQTYTVHKVAPQVSSIVRAGATPTNAGSVNFTVTFTKAVTGVDSADFTLTTTGVTGATVGTVSGTGSTRTVAVSTGTGDGTIRLDLTDNDTITDGGGNALVGPGGPNGTFTTGQIYAIDKTAPTVQSINRGNPSGQTTSASSVEFAVTFSESVTGVDASDFSLNQTGTLTGASITSVTGSGSTRTVTVGTGTGEGNLRLDVTDNDTIVDAATNTLVGPGNVANGSFTTGEIYTIDRLPFVASITRAGASPTNAATVNFTVTFSESVTGVDSGDFNLTTTGGVTGASVGAVTGTGSTRNVAVPTGTGNGTIRLNLTDNDTIVDTSSQALVGPGNIANGSFTTGEVYTIDKTAPVGTPTTRDSSGTNDGKIEANDQIIISFNETMNVSSFCSAWSGNGSNHSLTDGVVAISNGSPDTLTVNSVSCTGGFNFGTLNLGANDYVSSALTFTSSTIEWNGTTNKLTITFGTCVGCTASNPATVNKSKLTYVPPASPAAAITDVAGNRAIGDVLGPNVDQF